MTPTLRELTPEQALKHLELLFTRNPDGLLQGDHAALLPGPGSELSETRPYVIGDDVRRMDWNATARTTVPHVRLTLADRELTTWIVLDASASMDFGTARMEKRDLAVGAAASVAFLTERAGNRLGAQITGPYGIRRIPPRSGRQHLLTILRAALDRPRVAPGAPDAALADALRALRVLPGRGLVAVVSDFLETGWEQPLRSVARRHQVLAVETVDPREMELPDVGLLTVVDPETGRRRDIPTHTRKVRERYAEAALEQRALIKRSIHRAGAAHLRLRTDRDWVRDVVRYVDDQRRRAGGGAA
ncbi:DUF58 domain-containing protein [Streptomyces lincolnensis]|uniref:DUF58 domain-containing protein n=1 Tax=Streptomyces lincolnensis TaxID=1915 RepID=A0A1B1M6B8_STRLN|nr:DUF58 domain-containing protein [Streptomyces lincolnensis]ANS63983.1 hypothetical protein SLINC_1759 [Streptomyces lincolnensis]AXG57807.1 hypothetical protein SLCG_6652 [Streptomyces lincolnensis]QMV05826.1 DUF58 domain-containing protein [Streptomyces lincolnensis]